MKRRSHRTLLLVFALCCFCGPVRAQHFVFIEAEFEDEGGVTGLEGHWTTIVSPDGQHIYSSGTLDDALVVFSRSAATGEITYVETLFDDTDGVDGLDAVRGITISPDGAHVYAAGLLDASVSVFSRNAGTGALTYVASEYDAMPGGPCFLGGQNGLGGAHDVAVSPDGAHVYVAGRSDNAVVSFSRNAGTGELTWIDVECDGLGGVDGLIDVEGITVSPDGKHVYTAAETDNAVAVFARDDNPGSPTFGQLTFVEALFDEGLDGMSHTVEGLGEANAVAVSPDGMHVYVASVDDPSTPSNADWLGVFARNVATGALTFVEAHDDAEFTGDDDCFVGLVDDSGVAVSPDGSLVFAAVQGNGGAVMMTRNPVTGAVTLADVVCGFDEPGVFALHDIAVSPDAEHVYVAGRDDAPGGATVLGSVAVFGIGFPAQTRYVATTGSDTNNDCTVPSNPCATIAHAVDEANDGDILDIGAGTYVEPGLLIEKNLSVQGEGVVVQ